MPRCGRNSAMLAVATLAVGSSVIPITRDITADPDLYWHVWAGQRIIEQRSIPRQDSLTFTAAGRPWVYHSWLGAVALGGLYEFAGGTGLAVYRLVMFAAV